MGTDCFGILTFEEVMVYVFARWQLVFQSLVAALVLTKLDFGIRWPVSRRSS